MSANRKVIQSIIDPYDIIYSARDRPDLSGPRSTRTRKLMKPPQQLNKCRCRGMRRELLPLNQSRVEPGRDPPHTWEDMNCLDFFEQWQIVAKLEKSGMFLLALIQTLILILSKYRSWRKFPMPQQLERKPYVAFEWIAKHGHG